MAGGFEPVLLYLLLILVGAKVGGEVASRLKQPPVLGEILMGILLGPSLLGLLPSFELLDSAIASPASVTAATFPTVLNLRVLAVLAQFGVLLLLFEVGLESNLGELRRVGASAGLVGFFGVLFSLALGWAASELLSHRFEWVLTPEAQAQPHLLHAFVGATLAATSVGITARVLNDLGKIRAPESQIILGAAVFDDVLGLIVLAIVGSLVVSADALTAFSLLRIFASALGFFVLAIVLGVLLAPRMIDLVHRTFRSPYVHLGFGVIYMLLVSWLATWVGLAAIVGAFASGLALSRSPHRHAIFDHVKPVTSLFVGFFFVVLGARVDLSHVSGDLVPRILLIGLLLSGVGILAKLAAGWGVVGTRASRYVVGIGMVPRGEVGLIFALFGLEHGLLANWQYTTIILVVLLTTLITPLWLKSVSGRFTAPTATSAPQAVLQEALQP